MTSNLLGFLMETVKLHGPYASLPTPILTLSLSLHTEFDRRGNGVEHAQGSVLCMYVMTERRSFRTCL